MLTILLNIFQFSKRRYLFETNRLHFFDKLYNQRRILLISVHVIVILHGY
jgi:hypothetical protein